jgi:RimJ/RimL family protein N-acetyltransferase
MMPIAIETPRLLIRELLPADDAGMFELDSDPEVMRYIGRKPVQRIEESRAVIDFVRSQYATNGIGRWAVVEKASGDFLGWVGFKLIRERINNHTDFYDFGYRFIRRRWGQGFATEASIASLHYGKKELRLPDIFAMTDRNNDASRHLLEKLGFRFIELFRFEQNPGWRTEDDLEATWYKLEEGLYT